MQNFKKDCTDIIVLLKGKYGQLLMNLFLNMYVGKVESRNKTKVQNNEDC